tara:strand:+ start:256 stop:948 length:693 start_codon:yes stop_codon:yes gene_type:complete
LVKKILFIGANSDFGKSVIERFDIKGNALFCVSREEYPFSHINSIKVNNYIDSLDEIKKLVIDNDINEIVMFNGFIYEGIENKAITNKQIKDTVYINFLIPAAIITSLNKLNIKLRFSVISSIAASKLRLKNFYYGLSKQALEDFILNQKTGKYLIFRSGFIFTKLTKLHKTPPFAISKEKASFIFYKNFIRRQNKQVKFFYSSKSIFLTFILFKLFPTKLLNFIEKKIL